MTKSLVLALAFLFGSATLLCASSASPFLTQPYLQNPTQRSVCVMWQTKGPAYGWVEYGRNDTLGMKADTVTDGMRNANTTLHKVHLAPLEPGVTYYYRACFKPILKFAPYKVEFGDSVYSETYRFQSIADTAPEISCVIFNDLHNNYPLFSRLCGALGNRDCQFSIFNGDCISDPQSRSAVLDALVVYNKGIAAYSRPPLYIRGNHEIRGAFARELKGLFDFPGNEYFFAMTAGPVRFLFLDCGEDKSDDHREYSGLNDFAGYREKQKEWLNKEVASEAFLRAKHRVLVHHIPLYNHDDRGISVFSRASWSPVLDSVPIDVAISGHTHRHAFMPAERAGNRYPVLIGGGSKVESATVIVLSATEERLHIAVLNVSGDIVGEYDKCGSGTLKALGESSRR